MAAGLATASMLALAVAAWLIPASIHIVSWSAAGEVGRIALLAPAWTLRWLVVAALLLMVAVWYAGDPDPRGRVRRAHVLAPLAALWLWAVPFLPVVPDRLPLVLVLAGPLRWLIAAAAAMAVVARLRPAVQARAAPWLRVGRRTAFVGALVLYLVAGYRSLHLVGLGGDEPHYLVITQSLLLDHDIRIENNHTRGDYRQYFGGPLRPDYLMRGVDGAIYSIHAPGLPALVLPAFMLGGAWGVVVFIALCGALAALAVFDMAWLVGSARAAWPTWAGICLTVPFVPHAWAIFPEMPGAAIVAWALLWSMRDDRSSWRGWLWRGCCVALLPWLHTKFAVFLAVLALTLVWRARKRWAHAIACALPIGLSLIAWAVFFLVIYGTIDPQAPYGTYTAQFVRLENLPRSLAGTLFDQKFGLLIYAPVYAAVFVGAVALVREPQWRGVLLVSLGLAAAYTLSSARLYMWWGGSSAPARFLVPVVPLLAPAMAAAFARVRPGLLAAHLRAALALSLLVAALGIVNLSPALLFSSPHGVARLAEMFAGGSPLPAALPTFTEENWVRPLGRLVLWLVAAAAAVLVAWALGRPRHAGHPRSSVLAVRSRFWLLVAEVTVFVVAAATLVRPLSADARAATVQQGRYGLLETYDPDARRGLDYRNGTLRKLSPSQWIKAAQLTFRLDPGEAPDPQGRLTEGLELPQGTYDVTVLFDERMPRSGDLLAALGGGHVLARTEGPLPSAARLHLAMPIPVPQLWVQMSDAASAAAARRVDIVPTAVVPRAARLDVNVRRVESVPGRPSAYLAYVDDNAFPEGGVFWTRGTSAARVLVAPDGAGVTTLTLHAGPVGGPIRLTVNGTEQRLALDPGETRRLTVPVPSEVSFLSITVQSSGAFVPAEVEPSSTDTRLLGCQVRVEVGG